LSVDKVENLHEPEIVNEFRCHFSWRAIYVLCAAAVLAYVFFDILDLDGSNWRVAQYPPKGALLVLNSVSESENSLPPDLPLARSSIGTDFTGYALTLACFRRVEGSTIAGLALSRRHRYRVALPRSSVPGPDFI
jgi:hypothetical protein